MMFQNPKMIVARVAIIAALTTGIVFAHGTATGIVKERMDIMSNVAATMKLLSGMANGTASVDAEKAASALGAVSVSLKEFPTMFPEHSGHAPSEAAPAIWVNTDEFTAFAQELEKVAKDASVELSHNATPTTIKLVLGKMAATCKACHAKYRIKR